MTNAKLSVTGLVKRYGDTMAVDGLSFAVGSGEIFALLGPNGAGKTTTLECIEGIRQCSSGEIRVAGLDPRKGGRELALKMGVQLQTQGLPESMTPNEAFGFFARYRGLKPNMDIATRFGLGPKLNAPYSTLSEGQKRRLSLALAVAHEPEVLILDEPTAGLDVESRAELHAIIFELKNKGTTILLASHDMAEVEKLADRAIVIIRGSSVAEGSPRELRSMAAGNSRIACATERGSVLENKPELPGARFDKIDGELAIYGAREPGKAITALVSWIDAHGDRLTSLSVEGPSLEERFLELLRRNA